MDSWSIVLVFARRCQSIRFGFEVIGDSTYRRQSKDLLREKDFQGLLVLLQNLPTNSWTSNEISILTAEAYKLKVMFANAPRHLSRS
jgi:hypothetical protein